MNQYTFDVYDIEGTENLNHETMVIMADDIGKAMEEAKKRREASMYLLLSIVKADIT